MKRAEAVLVLKKLTAYQPNQQFDPHTVDAWASELTRLDFEDSLEAVSSLALAPRMPGQPFLIELRDIVAEVGRTRARRLAERRHLLPDPPSGLDAAAYQRWLADTCRAASARDWTPPPALEVGRHDARPAIEALANAYTRGRP